MTTLAANKPRAYEMGERNHLPVIASDIIYEGAAVGLVKGTGHARPLAATDKFVGFAVAKADNSAGSAAAINVEVVKEGEIELTVAGVTITDIGQPVYATDDDTFTMSPVSSVFVGFVKRFVSSGVAVIEFDAGCYLDPYANYSVRETISAHKTLDAQDCGKLFWVDTDALNITLPAIADGLAGPLIVNGGSYGTIAVNLVPAAADMILLADVAGADNTTRTNTKATAQRGDRVKVDLGDADGYVLTEMVGIWA